jgi:methylglutaconyl-CoA hydratase
MADLHEYRNLELRLEGPVARVALNRPEVRNAFDGATLAELAGAFESFAPGGPARVVVLSGNGPAFSSGGDLRWMRADGATPAEVRAGADVLARALHALYACPLPTIALVHGAVIGGANGLVAACDFAAAAEGTVFQLAEVRLGLAPAVIAPFVLRKVGEAACRRLFLLAEKFDAAEAKAIGLVGEVAPAAGLEAVAARWTRSLLAAGPHALAACKDLLRRLPGTPLDEAAALGAGLLAELRQGAEGREGMAAFLEKRKPGWCPER